MIFQQDYCYYWHLFASSPFNVGYLFFFNLTFKTISSADPVSVRQTPHRNHVHKQSEKTTRVRTVLNEKQLHTLRTCYNANPRPDALMKEQLVEMTGLSPRVIRVWFQNKRCKDKKRSILMKQLQQHHGDKTVSVLLMHFQCEKFTMCEKTECDRLWVIPDTWTDPRLFEFGL